MIPPGFDTDVRAQAAVAAKMLADLRQRFGNWLAACNAYNSGRPDTSATTNQNYGPDVLARREALVAIAAQEGPVVASDPPVITGDEASEMFIADIQGQDHRSSSVPAGARPSAAARQPRRC